MTLKVLLVDDDLNICKTLNISLKSLNCSVTLAHSVLGATEALQIEAFDLVLSDFRMGAQTGSELLQEIKKLSHPPLVVIMTAFASIENALLVTRAGAFDYLAKPFSQTEVEHVLQKVRILVRLKTENAELKKKAPPSRGRLFAGMISTANQRLEEFVKKIAPSDSTVLLVGESGTGKSELARSIHASSPRSNKPFVVVNCTSLAESLIESEIFGHAKGAFTGAICDKRGKFELAHLGTLFLDEIGDLSLDAQARLLRFLQERVIERVGSNQTLTIDARVIAATHKNLELAVQNGSFREDLYYRLNVFECMLTPLRHREDDIPVLIQSFLAEFSKKDEAPKKISQEAITALIRYSWPGNIRELRNVIERTVLLTEGRSIEVSNLPEKILTVRSSNANAQPLCTLEEIEKRHILKVLEAERNLDLAAEILGITKVTLWRRRKEYGLP